MTQQFNLTAAHAKMCVAAEGIIASLSQSIMVLLKYSAVLQEEATNIHIYVVHYKYTNICKKVEIGKG